MDNGKMDSNGRSSGSNGCEMNDQNAPARSADEEPVDTAQDGSGNGNEPSVAKRKGCFAITGIYRKNGDKDSSDDDEDEEDAEEDRSTREAATSEEEPVSPIEEPLNAPTLVVTMPSPAAAAEPVSTQQDASAPGSPPREVDMPPPAEVPRVRRFTLVKLYDIKPSVPGGPYKRGRWTVSDTYPAPGEDTRSRSSSIDSAAHHAAVCGGGGGGVPPAVTPRHALMADAQLSASSSNSTSSAAAHPSSSHSTPQSSSAAGGGGGTRPSSADVSPAPSQAGDIPQTDADYQPDIDNILVETDHAPAVNAVERPGVTCQESSVTIATTSEAVVVSSSYQAPCLSMQSGNGHHHVLSRQPSAEVPALELIKEEDEGEEEDSEVRIILQGAENGKPEQDERLTANKQLGGAGATSNVSEAPVHYVGSVWDKCRFCNVTFERSSNPNDALRPTDELVNQEGRHLVAMCESCYEKVSQYFASEHGHLYRKNTDSGENEHSKTNGTNGTGPYHLKPEKEAYRDPCTFFQASGGSARGQECNEHEKPAFRGSLESIPHASPDSRMHQWLRETSRYAGQHPHTVNVDPVCTMQPQMQDLTLELERIFKRDKALLRGTTAETGSQEVDTSLHAQSNQAASDRHSDGEDDAKHNGHPGGARERKPHCIASIALPEDTVATRQAGTHGNGSHCNGNHVAGEPHNRPAEQGAPVSRQPLRTLIVVVPPGLDPVTLRHVSASTAENCSCSLDTCTHVISDDDIRKLAENMQLAMQPPDEQH